MPTSTRARPVLSALFLLTCLTACDDPAQSPLSYEADHAPGIPVLELSPATFSVAEDDSISLDVLIGGRPIPTPQARAESDETSPEVAAGKWVAPKRDIRWSVDPSSAARIVDDHTLVGLNQATHVTVTAEVGSSTARATGTVNAVPTQLERVGAQAAAGVVGRSLADSLAVQVLSARGRGIQDVAVHFVIVQGGGTLSHEVRLTDAEGTARSSWMLGTKPGRQVARAIVDGVGDVTFPVEVVPDLATARAEIVEGAGQHGVAGSELPSPLTLEVTDSLGNPLAGMSVVWSFGTGSGRDASMGAGDGAHVLTLVTDQTGRSSVRWTVGIGAGKQRASATVASPQAQSLAETAPGSAPLANLTFDAAVEPGDPVTLDLTPRQQTLEIGDALSFSVAAEDEFGNSVSDLDVQWRSSDPSVATVDSGGELTATGAGSVVVTAIASGLTETARIAVPPPSSAGSVSAVSGNGQTGDVGSTLHKPLTVQVTDADGNAVPGKTVTWSLDGGRGNVSPASSTTDTRGHAQTRLTLGSTTGTYTVQADVAEVGSVKFVAAAKKAASSHPKRVHDLEVIATSATSVTLRWTPVDDGSGGAANYALRYGSPRVNWNADQPTEVSLKGGPADGGQRHYTFKGLDPGTRYEFRLVTYRGELGRGAIFGDRSNKVSVKTAGAQGTKKSGEVTVTPSRLTLGAIGDTRRLTASAVDAAGTPVKNAQFKWNTLDAGIATVSSTGVVTAKGMGTVKIVANATCCGADTSAITVEPKAARVVVSPSSPGRMEPGDTQQFSASVTDAKGSVVKNADIAWSTADRSVATVNGSGLLTATGAGTTRVKATAMGVTGSVDLTVDAPSDGDDGTGPGSGTPSGTPVFADNFSTGAKAPQQHGYSWHAGAWTEVSRERSYSDNYSLKFTYGPDAPGKMSWSEQRFEFGAYLSAVWIEYRIYVPANFHHRKQAAGSENNKFASFWRDDYRQKRDWQFVLEYIPSKVKAGDSRLRPMTTTRNKHFVTSNGFNAQIGPPDPFIGSGGDGLQPGKWNHVRIELKAASGPRTSDGVAKLWVNGKLVLSKTDGLFWNARGLTQTALKNGYIMGWSNSGFTEKTEFFVDDFAIYDKNPGW